MASFSIPCDANSAFVRLVYHLIANQEKKLDNTMLSEVGRQRFALSQLDLT